jgi:hypothetical protein
MNAPDRIWAWTWNAPGIKENGKNCWFDYKPIFKDWITRGLPSKKHWLGVPKIHKQNPVEYIRADLVPQWQPIETAPKDGTEIIVLCRRKKVSLGWYFSASTNNKHWLNENGSKINPTHWMPLPN